MKKKLRKKPKKIKGTKKTERKMINRLLELIEKDNSTIDFLEYIQGVQISHGIIYETLKELEKLEIPEEFVVNSLIKFGVRLSENDDFTRELFEYEMGMKKIQQGG